MAVSESEVRVVVERHLGSRPRRVRRLSLSDFSTWDADDRVILRFAVDDEGDRQLRREATALPVLAEVLPVRVPSLELLDVQPDGHLVMGYQKLHGRSGEDVRPGPEHRPVLAAQIASVLGALHGLDEHRVAGDGLPRWPEADLPAQLSALGPYAEVLRDGLGGIRTTAMERFISGVETVPPPSTRLVVSHADIKGEHLLLDHEPPRLTAIIDWADIACLDPAIDVGSLAIWLGPAFVRDVGTRLGYDDATVARGLFVTRLWMLIGVGRMLAGENDWPEELVRNQLAWAFDESV
jgi:aminoglycoside phosphotransferase (APT) family kinase protein